MVIPCVDLLKPFLPVLSNTSVSADRSMFGCCPRLLDSEDGSCNVNQELEPRIGKMGEGRWESYANVKRENLL